MVDIDKSVRIRLKLKVGQMSPNPAIASVLGSRGVNIIKFLQDFNVLAKDYERDCNVIVVATILPNKKYSICVKGQPASDLIKKEINLLKGSSESGKLYCGEISMEQLHTIAQKKIVNVHTRNVDGMIKMLVGTARSIGIRILIDKRGEN